MEFENRYRVTKKLYMEWVRHPFKIHPIFYMWIILLIATVSLSVISIINNDLYLAIFYFIFVLFCIYRIFFRNIAVSERIYNSTATNQGAPEWDRIIRFGDCININEGNISAQYQWDQMSELIENREYLFLVMGKKSYSGLRLLKNAFTIGNSETFIEFIKNKHPNIEIKQQK